MIRKSVDVIRAAAAEKRGFAAQVIDPPKLKARFLEEAADLDRAADRLAELERTHPDFQALAKEKAAQCGQNDY